MGKENLKDKMKEGLSLSEMSEILGISRPKIYRHMEYFMKGEDEKVDHNLKEYFEKIIMDYYPDEDAMRKELKQMREYIDAEKGAKILELRKEYQAYLDRDASYDIHEDIMSTKEKIEEKEALNTMLRAIEDKANANNIKMEEIYPDVEEGEERVELTWNEGEIRSACVWGYRSCMVVIDADFDKCRDITLELIMKISGREFIIKRQKPEENERFVRVDIRDMPIVTSYRLKWSDKDQVKYTPVYPMGYARGPLF